jgi:hypothetical protein
VEGIGLDGFGYTVTITSGIPGSNKKSTLRKLVFPEEMKDMQNREEGRTIQTPERPLFKGSSSRSVGVGWPLPEPVDEEKGLGIEVSATKSGPDSDESRLQSSSSTKRQTTRRYTAGTGGRAGSLEGRGYTMRCPSPQSYFYETEMEEDSM